MASEAEDEVRRIEERAEMAAVRSVLKVLAGYVLHGQGWNGDTARDTGRGLAAIAQMMEEIEGQPRRTAAVRALTAAALIDVWHEVARGIEDVSGERRG
ncbi:hypothetical protein OKC48_20795 [Methylorubrum extorquens]|uniref:hypothetical protein n=1 Tax=Methylorubrum extorquens TaxID=408 RepID=UPI002238C411|nr:hypothetical protein [Methylorubrum extorquens]UYW25686.1 hypothetical protein OKC48_20795 [Methylorubrum extorquens]